MTNTKQTSPSSPRQPQETFEALYAKMLTLQSSALQQVCEFGKAYSLKLHTFFEKLNQPEASEPAVEESPEEQSPLV